MKPETLAQSAQSDPNPPEGLSSSLVALWHAKAGNWNKAHDLCQSLSDPAGSWIHAYLHREEGDLGNAGYWYSRAGRPLPESNVSLEEEWAQIVTNLA